MGHLEYHDRKHKRNVSAASLRKLSSLRQSMSKDRVQKIVVTKNEQYKALYEAFPTFPEKMMECLILRSKGNCREVFIDLASKGWEPIKYKKKYFTNSCDKHFTISYYHGEYSTKIYDKIVSAEGNTFLTYYKRTSNGINYCCLYKDNNNNITELKLKNCELEQENPLKQTSKSINTRDKRDISYLPL